MLFPWSKNQRRRELLAQPVPMDWLGYVQANVAYYRFLPDGERQKLLDITRILIAEKGWEGCGGLTLTEEMKVTIAAQAALLVLGLDGDCYPNVETILVYPQGFVVPKLRREEGWVIAGFLPVAGEAALQGPVIVSWEDALAGGRGAGDGRNVVLHEFAHKLDMRDGAADGAPYLRDATQVDEWAEVMSAEFQVLTEAAQAGTPTLLDTYGATNAAEFFAVATECFFEKPHAMQREHARLYAALRDYYRQDPAALMPWH